ncbi:hypothetical protein CLU79DRAFT_706275 [Phycomyces nitens]|nr:hypothetical protein CLU79DRAFT_706275 [Phycomyces nitens]
MSLNWAMMSPDGQTPVLLPGEKVFFAQDSVKMVLDCNENGYPGNSGGYWEANGTAILTNQRVVFAASSPTQQFQTLNVPVLAWKNWKLEQPWFGANYISGTLVPVPGGGLSKNGKLVLTFREGGAIQFTAMYRELLERMGETGQTPQHCEPLPAYEGPSSGQTNYPPPSSPPPPPTTQQDFFADGQRRYAPPPMPHDQSAMPGHTVYPPPAMPVPYGQTDFNMPIGGQSSNDLPPSYENISHK